MKVIKNVFYSMCLLLSCFSSQFANAQQTVNCSGGNFQNGAVCGNVGEHKTYNTIYILSPDSAKPLPSPIDSTARQANPFVIYKPHVPQESLVSDGELPPLTTFPGNVAFQRQRKR